MFIELLKMTFDVSVYTFRLVLRKIKLKLRKIKKSVIWNLTIGDIIVLIQILFYIPIYLWKRIWIKLSK